MLSFRRAYGERLRVRQCSDNMADRRKAKRAAGPDAQEGAPQLHDIRLNNDCVQQTL